jgi:hypothetical protein
MDIHTTEPLISEPRLVETKIAVGKLIRYKSLGIDQILAKLVKVESESL